MPPKPASNKKKRDRWLKLAQLRTSRALHNMELLRDLADTSRCEFTEEEVHKVVAALKTKLVLVESSFKNPKRPPAPVKFEL